MKTRTLALGFWALIVAAPSLSIAADPPPGRILGKLDGIARDGDHYFLLGWACQQGLAQSINVQLFTEQAGRLGPLLAETANLFNEPGVGTACRDAGAGQHRFLVVLPYGQGPASRLAVHGLRIAGNVPNMKSPVRNSR